MNKYNCLKTKLENLLNEVNLVIEQVDDPIKDYLKKYKITVQRYLKDTEIKSIKESNGGLLGTLRAISEYDNLSAIDSLYNAAYEVDLYYSKECKNW